MMTKQNIVILSGVSLVLFLIFLSFFAKTDFSKKEKKLLEKEIELKYKIEEIDKKYKENEIFIDSLSKVIKLQDSIIAAKLANIPKIKPKYDAKITKITTSSADTIAKFITGRYK